MRFVFQPVRFGALLAAGWMLAGVPEVPGAPVRLVSWNAESLTNVADRASSAEARLNSAALQLQGQRPDVVLLQGVPDWGTAQKLAARLDGGFKVVTCSSLAGKQSGELAILSRLEAGLGWADGWTGIDAETGVPTPGGYAIAALRAGDRWIAVSSVEFPDTVGARQQREAAMRELLTMMAAVGEWRTNRPTAFVFGGTLNSDVDEAVRTGEETLRLAQEAGFTSAFLDLDKGARRTLRGRVQHAATTADYVFADSGGYEAAAGIFPSILSDHAMVSVVWDPEGTMPAPPVLAAVDGVAPGGDDLFGVELKWWVAGLGCFVGLMFLIVVFRRPQPVFDPSHALPSSRGGNILFLTDSERADRDARERYLSERERRRMRPTMLGWLKERFIGRLVTERKELIDAQQQASEQAAALGRRVEKLQGQLFERIKSAEQRVQELEKELALAKAENRELIQANLLLAQRELDEARRKMEAAGG